ncbi:MAG: hypothetical protein Q8K82_12890 [Gemmatimonadaceae bacterium]|nr:hypothetical protein [Gemmatimonadaceae bacterium]
MSNEAEMPRSYSLSSIAKIALTTVASAALTVAAGYATYRVTSREPQLTYEMSEGPPLSTVGLTRRIYVLKVRNTGSREVEEFAVSLSMPAGRLEDVSVSRTAGLDLTEQRDSVSFRAKAAFFNPADSLTVSLLASSSTAEPIQVVVRGRGVVGKGKPGRQRTQDSDVLLSLTSSALAGIVVIMGLVTLVQRMRPAFLGRLITRIDTGEDRRVVLAYILEAAALYDLAKAVRSKRQLMFREVADMLYFRAVKERAQSQAVLECLTAMLLVPQMHPISREVVKRHLERLGASAEMLATRTVAASATALDLRHEIDKILMHERSA